MKQFFVFFLCFAIQFNCGRAFLSNQTDILASVREFPSLLHRCTATFIKPDILLTTARCLYCTGNCKLFVQAFSDHLTSGHNFLPQAFPVDDVVIHPDYERYPQRNDIGLIKLKSLVSEAIIFRLPSPKMKFRNLLTNTYAWKFSPDLQDYFLQLNPARTISNAICSLALNQYIDDTSVCVRGKEAFSFGAFDQGSPLLANYSGEWFILGMYVREGINRFTKSEIFQSVSPFTDWIKAEIERKYDITNVFTNAISLSHTNNIPHASPNTVNNNAPSSTTVTKPPISPTPAPAPAPPTPAPVPQTPPAPPAPVVTPAPPAPAPVPQTPPAPPTPVVTPAPPAPAPVPQTPSAPPTPTPNKPEANIQPNQTTDKKNPQNFRLNGEDNFDGKPLMLSDNFDM